MVESGDAITLIAFLLVCTFIIVLLSAVVKIRNVRKNLRLYSYLLNKSLTLDVLVKTYEEIIDLFGKKVYINIKRNLFVDPIYEYITKRIKLDPNILNREQFLYLHLKEFEVTALDEVFLKTEFCKQEYFVVFNLLSNCPLRIRKIKDILRFDSKSVLKSQYPKVLGINLIIASRDGDIYLKRREFEDTIYSNSFDVSIFYPLSDKMLDEVGEFKIEEIVWRILEKEFLIDKSKVLDVVPINMCLDLINLGIVYCNVFVLIADDISKYFDVCEKNLGRIAYKVIRGEKLREDLKEDILKNIKSLKSKYRLSTYALSFLDWIVRRVEKE